LSAAAGLTVAAGRDIRAALDAKRPIVVDVDHRGLMPAGESPASGRAGVAHGHIGAK
jgi:hypothetical protein